MFSNNSCCVFKELSGDVTCVIVRMSGGAQSPLMQGALAALASSVQLAAALVHQRHDAGHQLFPPLVIGVQCAVEATGVVRLPEPG